MSNQAAPAADSKTKPDETTAHITPQATLGPTIQAWKIYLEDQGNSPHTLKAFDHDLRLLAAYLPPDRPIGKITTTDLNNFLEWMQTKRGISCSPKTLARRITAVKAFFRWLHQNAVLLVDPAEKVLQKSVISPLPTVLTQAEMEAVLQTADTHRRANKPDARPYALVALLLETGIKKGECLALSLNHVVLDAPNGPFIFVRYANPQHRYKERKIPITESWITAYQEYKSQYQPDEQVFPWSPRRLEYILEDLGVEAGLTKHLSFDMCRWTGALNDWRSESDRNKIRQKLGISKIQWREISMKLAQLAGENDDD